MNPEKDTPAVSSNESAPTPPLQTLLEEKAALETQRDQLLSELSVLRENLETALRAQRRQAEEAELLSLFPELDLSALPDEVLQSAKDGLPLSAAYALYDCKVRQTAALAKQEEERNRGRSSGSIKGGNNTEGNFSLTEIAAMSRGEVRRNYREILRSLSSGKRTD